MFGREPAGEGADTTFSKLPFEFEKIEKIEVASKKLYFVLCFFKLSTHGTYFWLKFYETFSPNKLGVLM